MTTPHWLSDPAIATMLDGCPDDILLCWEYLEYSPGTVICEQDAVYDYFFIITAGEASIYRMAESGKRYIQSVYGKGRYFGELEIFGGYPYICAVEAVTAASVIRLQRNHFMRWIEQDYRFLMYITQTLCDSFYALSKKAAEDMLYSLTYRICMFLLDVTADQSAAVVQTDKRLLSERFGVTSRSINRVLKDLSGESLIAVSSESITIRDRAGLQQRIEAERDE